VIRLAADPEALARAAAGMIASRAREAVARRGRFSLALAGGSTPRGTYERLARSPLREQVPWERVQVFWGDERCVPGDDPRSNQRMARQALLDHVPLPSARIHPIACENDPAAAARHYEKELRGFFTPGPPVFDLVLLGLGEDGHTASLLPGDPALQERDRWVAAVRKPDESFARLTLTLPLLNRAAQVLFLVAGEKKAAILAKVFAGPPGRLPAQLVAAGAGEVCWLVDKAAAGKISDLPLENEDLE
jgi:6-phosphogluconolactonase